MQRCCFYVGFEWGWLVKLTAKRFVDVLLSALILLLSTPLMAIVATAIYIETGTPILFRQQRMGRYFKPFTIVKFRSMKVRMGGPSVTVHADARITRVGRILRKAKIDEIPQFWNVLRGEMSIVGPRPEILIYVEAFKDRFATVLRLRPGITDLASLAFRHEEEILAASPDPLRHYVETILPKKLDLAEEYAREQSLCGDLMIILRTVFALFEKSGRGLLAHNLRIDD
jgi:lipopolysaccharide/colanic/teichoic acid biosynthesis glycosyltransferase